jgi:hypothetical protein
MKKSKVAETGPEGVPLPAAAGAVNEEAFRTMCVLTGFDLPAFDAWLSTLEGHGVHRELTERRNLAWVAIRANNHDAKLRHLEWMLLRWKEISRTDFLLPLAQHGKKFPGRKEGSIGPVRKFLRVYMLKHPQATAAEAWAALKLKPPAGVTVIDPFELKDRLIKTTGAQSTSYRQFQNIVSKERSSQVGSKSIG